MEAASCKNSIGYPIDSVFRIVNREGADVPDCEAGELWIYNTNLMEGYLNDPLKTQKVFSGKWFRTGDLALRNCDGTISLVGRLKDIIKNPQGEIVSFAEVEEAIQQMDDVADVAVCSSSAADGSEYLYAFIVPKTDRSKSGDEWIGHLRVALLEKLGTKKLPSYIYLADSIPRNSNGKVLREKLLGQGQRSHVRIFINNSNRFT